MVWIQIRSGYQQTSLVSKELHYILLGLQYDENNAFSKLGKDSYYEGHPIKNETFALAQWIYMLGLWNFLQS